MAADRQRNLGVEIRAHGVAAIVRILLEPAAARAFPRPRGSLTMIGDLRRVLSNIRVEDGREAFSTLFVNPASAFVFVVANLLLHRAGSSFAALVNPWELTLGLWLAGWLAVRLALLGFVDGAVWVLGPRLPALPSRVGPKPIFQHTINALDCLSLIHI